MGGRRGEERTSSHCGNSRGTNKLPLMGGKVLKLFKMLAMGSELVQSREIGGVFSDKGPFLYSVIHFGVSVTADHPTYPSLLK